MLKRYQINQVRVYKLVSFELAKVFSGDLKKDKTDNWWNWENNICTASRRNIKTRNNYCFLLTLDVYFTHKLLAKLWKAVALRHE